MTLLRGLSAIVGTLAAIGLGLVAAMLAAGAVATALIAARVEAHFPPLGRFVDVEGGRVALIEAGPSDGARGTAILIHGASANTSDPMAGFGYRLAERGFRVLAFDRPGFGWSDRLGGADAATPAFQAGAIAAAIDKLGIGPAIVYGHSWGGAPALRLALDRPDRVSGLVLAAPVAMPLHPPALPWWARLALEPWVTRILARTIAVPLGLYYLPKASAGVFQPEPVVGDYAEKSRASLILRPGPALANIQDLAGLPNALSMQAERYGALRLPVTILSGDADRIVETKRQAAPLAAAIPNARLVTLPGVGHMLHVTAPDRIIAEFEALQAKLDEARSP